MTRLGTAALMLLLVNIVWAQDSVLVVEDVEIVTRLDAYGQQVPFAVGELVNTSETAYNQINLFAEALDSNGDVIGEGIGYLETACGAGLLPDFVLQPGKGHPFAISLELYESDVAVDEVSISVQGQETEAAPPTQADLLFGVTRVTDKEVALVEWEDDSSLLYGTGCAGDVFTMLEWYAYNVRAGVAQPVEHPDAEQVDEALLTTLELTDPLLFRRSFLSFVPGGRRALYQTPINSMITIEPDGSFPRVLLNNIYDRTLQGIEWLADGRFLAYYYGAFGDPVTYFVADVNGTLYSAHPSVSFPSGTVPGASPDGRRVVVTTMIDGITGYFINRLNQDTRELLFEADVPGNNWPEPLMLPQDDGSDLVYVARPVDGLPMMQCYNTLTKTLSDITPLPLQLATDERARWWLSPNGTLLALAANGVNGGLWLIEMSEVGTCE